MNQELLNLYTVLQPFFRERMGEWQVGDYWHSEKYKMGGWYSLWNCEQAKDKDTIIVPHTIDDSSPKAQARSLLGMLEVPPTISFNGFTGKYICSLYDKQPMLIGDFDGATVTEAILKALCVQEGVEV
jgi:hypothetical protein